MISPKSPGGARPADRPRRARAQTRQASNGATGFAPIKYGVDAFTLHRGVASSYPRDIWE